MEYLGPMPIPEPAPSGLWPLPVDYGMVRLIEPRVVVHQFGTGDAKREQRFYVGDGQRRIRLELAALSAARKQAIVDFAGIAQDITAAADTASFTLGNADRVLSGLAGQVDLDRATVEFSLFHTGTRTRIDLCGHRGLHRGIARRHRASRVPLRPKEAA